MSNKYEAMLEYFEGDPRLMASASLRDFRNAEQVVNETLATQAVQAVRTEQEQMAMQGELSGYEGLYPGLN